MQKRLESDEEELFIINDICCGCWCTFIFHDEGFHDLDAILGHPQLHRRFKELCSFEQRIGTTCVVCSASTLPGAPNIAGDVYFRGNDALRKAKIEGCQLEELFENIAVTTEQLENDDTVASKTCTVSSDFNLCVLAVHFSRTAGRAKRYLCTFAKNCVKIDNTGNVEEYLNKIWQTVSASAYEFAKNIAAIADPTDDLTSLMRSYCEDLQGHTFKPGGFKVLIKRIKKLVANMLEAESARFAGEYVALFRCIDDIYEKDKHLFEQLLRMQVNVTIDAQERLKITNFEISRDVVTFAGYYNKFARGMSQTAWTPDKNTKSNLSVEECLCIPLLELCNGSSYKFMASGREDCDVRTTGPGRKFCVEVYTCKRDLFHVYDLVRRLGENSALNISVDSGLPILACMDDIIAMKEDITVDAAGVATNFYFLKSKHANQEKPSENITIVAIPQVSITEAFDYKSDASVHLPVAVGFYGLRLVFDSRAERQIVQIDAENKNKTYSCLVFSEDALALEQLQAIPKGPFTIMQCNPVRTSHRKSQCGRERQIHELTADPLHPRLFLLTLKTQAGTYVKEFVTGDIGRTTPSVKSLLGAKSLYVVHLDVVDFS
ncbi:putative tRNA pseudouridine synthase Pus10 [Babesia sp. Xinjiang]|uniref:putative tRNA pseudouridine synthase Pus10 n=1 Tax=Babesia sp. Xinjiang TaxID=462227 RepID=UPI000A21977B|nr:putative tRNA pseudouridine synthase Pus10 [Babesia sp. Xinjiang]ORM40386.1 putative tRNA pseudouridine synthase Pus10 [Babesia sp. Xinjiang]